jgi:hypothetical protein
MTARNSLIPGTTRGHTARLSWRARAFLAVTAENVPYFIRRIESFITHGQFSSFIRDAGRHG